MWGGDDPDCRKPMVWKELTYETETTHPFGMKRDIDKVEFNSELFDWYKKLINIRKDNIELSLGDVEYSIYESNDVLQYTRTLGENKSIIIVNNKNESKDVVLPSIPGISELKNILANFVVTADKEGYKVNLKPYELIILKK